MGEVIAFKTCSWRGNGLCIATSILACVCYRDSKGKPISRLPAPVPPYLALGRDAGSIADTVDYSNLPKECPPPWELLQGASADLIEFAKQGEPKVIEIDDHDTGC